MSHSENHSPDQIISWKQAFGSTSLAEPFTQRPEAPGPFRLDDRNPAEQIVAWLDARGATEIPHTTGKFRDHLVGTWRILNAWGQPDDVALCGLLHSVLSTDIFATAIASFEELRALTPLLDEATLHLVVLFGSVDRVDLGMNLAALPALPSEGIAIRHRTSGETAWIPSAVVADLLIIEMANTAEQSCETDRRPGHWMTMCAHLGRLAADHARVVPPVFDRCTSTLSDENEKTCRNHYQRALDSRSQGGTPETTVAAARAACRANPFAGEPKLLLARELKAAGQAREAERFARAAWNTLASWATAWDKRRSWSAWLGAAQQAATPGR